LNDQDRRSPPHDARALQRAASCCADEMRRIGMQHVRLIGTPGFSVVYADWLGAAGAPTLLFYGHFDVPPVDPGHPRESPPFAVTVCYGEMDPRGSTDDHDQTFRHFPAVEAHLTRHGTLPVNVRVILECDRQLLQTSSQAAEDPGGFQADDPVRRARGRDRGHASTCSHKGGPDRRRGRAQRRELRKQRAD
jgi:hypothetical protein